jgi:uncharacterized membrane protein YidH (DUF202 family)
MKLEEITLKTSLQESIDEILEWQKENEWEEKHEKKADRKTEIIGAIILVLGLSLILLLIIKACQYINTMQPIVITEINQKPWSERHPVIAGTLLGFGTLSFIFILIHIFDGCSKAKNTSQSIERSFSVRQDKAVSILKFVAAIIVAVIVITGVISLMIYIADIL